jgi:serine/threonine protein kinase/WD40 repeat protein
MSECPSDDDLSRFLNESLPHDRFGPVSMHVDKCSLCQNRLDKLTNDADRAVARYKHRPSNSPSPEAALFGAGEDGTLIMGMNTPPAARLLGVPLVPGFEVLQQIGRGGMGVVYKARHERLNRLVALKMILAGGAADPSLVQRFMFEAEILARVQHPQVVQVYEVDTYQGASGVPIPYLAMELLEGGSLASRLRSASTGKATGDSSGVARVQPLEPHAAAELIEGIARAVHCAHLQGVIHRDLKPANILFPGDEHGSSPDSKAGKPPSPSSTSHSRSGLAPKVTDFGLAKFTQQGGADLTGSGQILGTPHYMAPEQAAGHRQIGPAADVYALGAILYECLSGRTPFPDADPMSVLMKVVNEAPPDIRGLRPDLHRDLAAVVMRCLAKDPRRRYASAAELADDLRRYLERRPTLARPVSLRERTWLWAKRNPAVAGLVVALGLVLFTAFAVITTLWVQAEDQALSERYARELANLAEGRAIASHKQTTSALQEVERQKRNADLNRAQLEFSRAVNWCEEGRVAEGLDSFVRTVELAEAVGAADLARVARINLAAWPRVLPAVRKSITNAFQTRDVAFFPDSRRAAASTTGGEVFVWDTAANQKVHTYRTSYKLARLSFVSVGLQFAFWTVAISPDGKTVAAGGADGQIWIWDADKADPRAALAAAPAGKDVWAIAFAPDGTLFSTCSGPIIKRWDLAKEKVIAETPKSSRPEVSALILSADGKRLYTGDWGAAIQEWDAERLERLRTWTFSGWVNGLALSADGKHLASTGTDGFVHVLNLESGREVQRMSLAGAYGHGVAFGPDGSLLIASDADGAVRGWDWRTGVPVGVPLTLSGETLRPRFFPNSGEFAIPAGNAVRRCRMADQPGRLVIFDPDVRVRGLDYSPDGDRLAIAHEGVLSEFRLEDGKLTRSPRFSAFTLTMRYDPDRGRNRLVRGLRSGLDVIQLPDFTLERVSDQKSRLNGMCFGPAGDYLYTMDRDNIMKWDARSLDQPIDRFRDPELPNGVSVAALDVRPDGRELLFSYANRIVFLNAQTLQKSRPGWRITDDILDAKFLPGGERVLIGRRDSVAQIYDAAAGAPLGPPMTHARAVLSVDVSPDGQFLLTGGRDGAARYWDAATGLPLGFPLRHSGPVTHVRFRPRGTQAATGSGGGDALVWPLPPPPLSGSIDQLRAASKRDAE